MNAVASIMLTRMISPSRSSECLLAEADTSPVPMSCGCPGGDKEPVGADNLFDGREPFVVGSMVGFRLNSHHSATPFNQPGPAPPVGTIRILPRKNSMGSIH